MYNGNAPSKGQQGWPVRHGLTNTKVHMAWRQMKKRCLNPKCKAYPNYGGRGITVCDRWLVFENFFTDMGHPPEGMTLERIDNDGNYSPDNCRWATYKEQMNNTRRTTMIEINGIRKRAIEWSIIFDTTLDSFKNAARKLNWIK